MSDSTAILRAMLIYGICLPLAIFLGYSLATPDDRNTMALVGVILFTLSLPLLLRWYHPVLIFSWNMGASLFFLPGKPQLWLVMVLLGLVIALTQFAINRNKKFLPVRSVILPLIFLTVVIFFTAWFNGGIGLGMFGGGTYGGKRYILLFAAILGYFALVSRQIPVTHANRYAMFFLLSSATSLIFQLATAINPSLYMAYPLFPSDEDMLRATSTNVYTPILDPISRLAGLAGAARAVCLFLLASFGIRKMFELDRVWRLALMGVALALSFFGGFRSIFIGLVATFAIIFYLEGLLRTRVAFWLVLTAILAGVLVIPFTNKLPLSVQRTISFLPVRVDPIVAADAQASTDWRLEMWKALWPEIPRYLFLGKGYAINAEELELSQTLAHGGGSTAEVAMLAGDYHNGPLSVIIPLGIAGMVAMLWFLGASIHALYRNYLYGEPELKHINTFLFAYFLVRIILFFGVYGSLYADLAAFTGLIGFSISLNGGMRGPVVEPLPVFINKRAQPEAPPARR